MESEKDLKILRHSAAHLLAHAVIELFPKTKLTIGPATEEGFFYDFLPEKNFKEEDLPKIEAKMHEISQRNLKIEHKEISKDEARKIFKDNPFKMELIHEIPGETVGLSTQGNFYDLCRGGHVKYTNDIKYFKLFSISGAYWKANKEGTPLQRINGTAFYSEKELIDYEKRKEDLLRYDHRKVGKELDLFSFHDEGPGFPFFHPKGKVVLNLLIEYMRKLQQELRYKEISTPIILSDELWRQSGHYKHYKENMYFTKIDNKKYAIRPMNCPGSILIYKNKPKSYKELPLRLSEFGLVHRHELSGVLHGLLRVRSFTIDDAHIYCTINQVENEIFNIIKYINIALNRFGFDKISIKLSTRPQKAMGSIKIWNQAIDLLKKSLDKSNIKYDIAEGEGAFYGPKIEFKVQDSMGRVWQLSTIQIDFFLPKNFELSYINSKGEKETPIIIHQAIYGSLERFFAILLEHHKGNLPIFIAPVQVKILTITDDQKEYAIKTFNELKSNQIRIEIDETSDPISGKIKNALNEKIPLMIIIGKKEVENNNLTIRYLDGKQETLTIENVIKKFQNIN